MADIGTHIGADGDQSPDLDGALGEVARRFFPGGRIVHLLGGSTGHSGSIFARAEAAGGAWCLRLWPPGFDKGRLRDIHRSLIGIRANGFAGVPKLAATPADETMVEVSGRLADAQEWVAGRPLSAVSPAKGAAMPNVVVAASPQRLENLALALAGFHRAGTGVPVQGEHRLPSLSERLAGLAVEVPRCGEALMEASRVADAPIERELAARWLGGMHEALDIARTAAKRLPAPPGTGEVLCHGDLWPAHAHFEGDAFVGFTDFESIAVAPPAFDLAQLVVHFGGWGRRKQIIRAYESASPAGGETRAALPVEAVADLVGEGLWSLGALYGRTERGLEPTQRAAHLANLASLISPLESASIEAREDRP